MIDAILGIDVSKNTLDVSISICTKVRSKSFANSSDGWHHLLDWLIAQKMQRVHACLESTGRYSLGIACSLYEAGHVVSIINPAQIRDFVRTKLGRNKTDGIDASRIREYCELFKPSPWAPPSEAHRRLGELQTIRAGIIAGLTEWKNRKNSGIVDTEAQALADATILHFTSQLGAVDKAIALTIDNDSDLRSKRDLLLSINGVGDTLAGVVLAELPGPDVLRSSGEVVAYAGLNPRQHQSGTSVDRATRISKIGNAVLRAALYMPALSAMRYNPAIVALVTRLKSRGRLKPKQIVVAAMRKLLVLCFGVLKTGKPFDPLMWLNSPSLSRDRKVCPFLEHRNTAPTASASRLAPQLRDCTAWRIGPACIVQREERRCQSWRCVSLDRRTFPTAAAGSIPHRRPPRRSSAVRPDRVIQPTRPQPKSHQRR